MTNETDIQQLCRTCLATMLDIDETAILPTTTFASLGLDSATAVHFVLEVEQKMGIELDPGVTFECPTLAEFADHVRRRIG